MSKNLKIIFAGTPHFAAYHLEKLLSSRHRVVAVFTQPDRPFGRGNKMTSSAVKQIAIKNIIPVFQPYSLKSLENQQLFKTLNPDIIVVVAYGMILPKAILQIPRLGCINVHGSLLPRWRGAAPIQRALWAGDKKTGITIIQMNMGVDTGDILYKISCPIDSRDTSVTLYHKLENLGAVGMLHTLDSLSTGNVYPEIQDETLVSYAMKLTKEEARLNWSLSATQLERCIRAFNPWPISYFVIDKIKIKVWKGSVLPSFSHRRSHIGEIVNVDKKGIQIATTDGLLNIEELQPSGKKIMKSQDLLNSRREWFTIGHVLD